MISERIIPRTSIRRPCLHSKEYRKSPSQPTDKSPRRSLSGACDQRVTRRGNVFAPPGYQGARFGLQGLHHRQNDDADQEQGRDLVQNAEIARRMKVDVCRETIPQPHKIDIDDNHEQHEQEFQVEPAGSKPMPTKAETDPARQDENERRPHDAEIEPPFHDFEGFRLCRALLSQGMINEEARQIEHARHEGDHGKDMQGLEPEIDHASAARIWPSSASTCATGVSGKIPWPKLKICGRPAKAERIRSVPSCNARPPATSARGSRFPCRTVLASIRFAAATGSIVSSSPSAS